MKIFFRIILITGVLAILIGYISIINFDLFDTPQREIINLDCNHDGQRQVLTYKYASNSVTRPSIHVSVAPGCLDEYDVSKEHVIFTADHFSINGTELSTVWLSKDSLLISYDSTLRIFTKKEHVDLRLPITITYHKK